MPWEAIAKWGFLVLGGLGGFFGARWIDRRQAKKLGKTEERLKSVERTETARRDAREEYRDELAESDDRWDARRRQRRVPDNRTGSDSGT